MLGGQARGIVAFGKGDRRRDLAEFVILFDGPRGVQVPPFGAVEQIVEAGRRQVFAAAMALVLLIGAALILGIATTTGTCLYQALAPSIVVAIVGIAYSIAGRLLLLNVPKDVRRGRHCALVSFSLPLLARSSFGAGLGSNMKPTTP